MKKLAFILIAIVVSTTFSMANIDNTGKAKENPASHSATISGSVSDILGESVVGAEISIRDTNVKAYSDFDGNFSFKDLKPGKYSLIVSYVAHTNSLIEIEVKQGNDESVEVQLKEE